MGDLLSRAYQAIDEIDFEGQRTVNTYHKVFIILFAIISFAVGFVMQNFKLSVYIYLACCFVLLLCLVPAWPYLKRNKIQWLAPTPEGPTSEVESGKKKD